MKNIFTSVLIIFAAVSLGAGMAAASPYDRIVGVNDSGFSKACNSGSPYWWLVSYSGIDYWYTYAGNTSDCYATWRPNMGTAGNYKIYTVFWARTAASGYRSNHVEYTVLRMALLLIPSMWTRPGRITSARRYI